MKRKNKKDYEMVITPYMKHIDQELLKIEQRIVELRVEYRTVNNLFELISKQLAEIQDELDMLKKQVHILIQKEKEREENKLINKIKKWLSLYPVMRC